MERYVCIHGHFYQPPRENPWLEAIEVQDSAYPYRDWNERITAECYSPNTAARILDHDNRVVSIVNNYSKISFNFGPTLLTWMEENAPDVYVGILKADNESQKRFSGHGSAIAQVYNHIIMPLANSRDKRTSVAWGIEDFRYRFKRDPEGMWLAETAVDIESLELLAEYGIKFTILAPHQAKRIRKTGEKNWTDVQGAKIDPKRVYLCKLPSGRKINLFFYDGPISQEIAFGDLLKRGENLANRLAGAFTSDEYPQLSHIATDGETYGHHHHHGDMGLAYCLHYIETNKLAKFTVYGEFLEKHPPEFEAEIIENSSWSCVHGIERWRSDCGCNSGRQGWNQQWRKPLREALDWLRDAFKPIYEKGLVTDLSKHEKSKIDMWKVRDNYIKVILDRHESNINAFLKENGINGLNHEEKVKLLKLLELQRHTLLMYTSCGWFFDEVTGIETVQVILYAARAIQLAKELNMPGFELQFMELLEKVPSNIEEIKNAAVAYNRFVKPSVIDLYRVAAHYAASSLFEDYNEVTRIYSYEVRKEIYEIIEAGRQKAAIGKAVLKSRITQEERPVTFAFLHMGDHNINGGVREWIGQKEFDKMVNEIKSAFHTINVAEIITLLNKHFPGYNYSIWHLFKDERRKVFNRIMKNTLMETEFYFRRIYENHYSIMNAMMVTQTPLPAPILTAVEFIINSDIKKILTDNEKIDTERLLHLADEAKKLSVPLDKNALSYAASKRINLLMKQFESNPDNLELMKEIVASLQTISPLSLDMDIWKAQNILFFISKAHLKKMNAKSEKGDKNARKWLSYLSSMENYLQVKIS